MQRINKRWRGLHSYNCAIPFPGVTVGSVARQALSELRPDSSPSEIAITRRTLGRMLDKLEALERTTVTVVPAPLLLTAAKRPHVVAEPRAITNARAQHEQWLAHKKEERTA